MNRTLEGFLKRYCMELSGLRTTSLRKLCVAARENARLVEPLFAFAAVQGKEQYLAGLSEGAWFHDDYAKLAGLVAEHGSLQTLLESDDAPDRYKKVLDAYEAQGDGLAADRRMNGLIRPKILAALEKRGMTRYQLCKSLDLNLGNVYAFLAGDDGKVSLETARRMLAHVQRED
jgi:hypothetical protein